MNKVFTTKKEAQQAGRATARREGTEQLIHNRHGKIGERNSYGGDPHPAERRIVVRSEDCLGQTGESYICGAFGDRCKCSTS